MRLFAYHGGPLALDAAINGMIITTLPQQAKDVEGWFEDLLGQLVRTNAAAAASIPDLNQKNMMQTIKLSLRASAAAAKTDTEPPLTPYEKTIEKLLASIHWTVASPEPVTGSEDGQKQAASDVGSVPT